MSIKVDDDFLYKYLPKINELFLEEYPDFPPIIKKRLEEYEFQNKDYAECKNHAVVVKFAEPRNVAGTSALNGGYSEQLTGIFNQDCKYDGTASRGELPANLTYEAHLQNVASQLGFDPARCMGMTTAADMENAVVSEETQDDLTVTAIVTAGVDKNGGRVGDPSSWSEHNGEFRPIPGTVNIMLFFQARLTPGALTRAIVTATEAKTAVLQELVVPSCVSSGLATGSGTDGVIAVSDLTSKRLITDTGKHNKAGELIGRVVMRAVRQALEWQTQLNPVRQHNVLAHLGRFELTENLLLQTGYQTGVFPDDQDPNACKDFIAKGCTQGNLVVKAATLAHLLDLQQWGILSRAEVLSELVSWNDMKMDKSWFEINGSASSYQRKFQRLATSLFMDYFFHFCE